MGVSWQDVVIAAILSVPVCLFIWVYRPRG